jgi:hypothetical protein
MMLTRPLKKPCRPNQLPMYCARAAAALMPPTMNWLAPLMRARWRGRTLLSVLSTPRCPPGSSMTLPTRGRT